MAQSSHFSPISASNTGAASPPSSPLPHVYEPVYYFFYGTLTKPHILKEVLGLDTEPVLRPAKIHGYGLTNWGQYLALIDGEPGTVVTGFACKVQSAEEEYKLSYYETNAYTLHGCKIHFTARSSGNNEEEGPVFGNTFLYAGDAQALKEGRFDRTLWEVQMGIRLPPHWRRGARGDAKPAKTDEQVSKPAVSN
ncbi:hypothetical protein C8A00DRAFT_19428 [Chaetomidium leptoderma]|uniref:Putative gamma-glutamylcyclotransferase n=1 Tax=Chaetomidium leptoderma TaxID=669021 RepID=A0AAN6VCB3_9PEZI|nr:hypothetical protein C8A00DRAFT_19428 [Chaetomidium leptoderma]